MELQKFRNGVCVYHLADTGYVGFNLEVPRRDGTRYISRPVATVREARQWADDVREVSNAYKTIANIVVGIDAFKANNRRRANGAIAWKVPGEPEHQELKRLEHNRDEWYYDHMDELAEWEAGDGEA